MHETIHFGNSKEQFEPIFTEIWSMFQFLTHVTWGGGTQIQVLYTCMTKRDFQTP